MDKYVIKTPRVKEEKTGKKRSPTKQKQATIESLSRVVVIEEVKQWKAQLSLPEQNVEVLTKCLKELKKRIPSKEILLETKIGHVVNKLRKHENSEVKNLASALLSSWKGFFKEFEQRQVIEVRCDKKTEDFRKKAKKLLAEVLECQVSSSHVEMLERCIYLSNNRSINTSYRKIVRQMHFKMKNHIDLKNKYLENKISVEEFHKQFLAS